MIPELIDHLWQSTLFVAAAWLLVQGLRKNRAQVRYWVWLTASVKFLIPFSFLVWIGMYAPASPVAQTEWIAVVDQISQPFTAPAVAAQTAVAAQAEGKSYLAFIMLALWACGFAAVAIRWLVRWARVRALQQSAEELRINTELPVPMMSSGGLLEPGVFGLFRPVLLLPQGIVERLDPAQFEAIIAHELCHVRRKDNLTAAIHMSVEAIFWFHPLVWWLGSRLVDERERACDEEVLRLGGDPSIYAEGILKVCKFYVESPLPCVSGVSGSNLKKRIEAIMRNSGVLRLNFAKKAVLALAGMAALAMPLIVGMMNTPAIRAQSAGKLKTAAPPNFAVATIKPSDAPNLEAFLSFPSPGRLSAPNFTLRQLIIIAYSAEIGGVTGQVTGGPSWINQDRYIVQAQAEGTPTNAQMLVMLRALLAERFALKVHTESKDRDVYALVLASRDRKLGPKVTPWDGTCRGKEPQPAQPDSAEPRCAAFFQPPGLFMRGVRMEVLAQMLSRPGVALGRPVVDRTDLSGEFDFDFEYQFNRQAPNGGPAPADPLAPSLFTALQEQLGLKLESSKGTVESIVVDSEERPTEN